MDRIPIAPVKQGFGWLPFGAVALVAGTASALFSRGPCPYQRAEMAAVEAAREPGWQARCSERLGVVQHALAEGALGEPFVSTVEAFDGAGGPGVYLRVGDRRFVAGAIGARQADVGDRDWYDLNHGFVPAYETLPGSLDEPAISLFKDEDGRSAFIASTDEDGARRIRFFGLVRPAIDDCLALQRGAERTPLLRSLSDAPLGTP